MFERIFRPKRKNDFSSELPVKVANIVLVLAVFFVFAGVGRFPIMHQLQETIAGAVMTFFWPLVAIGAGGLLLLSQYRQSGEPAKARATLTLLLAMSIIGASSLVVVSLRYY